MVPGYTLCLARHDHSFKVANVQRWIFMSILCWEHHMHTQTKARITCCLVDLFLREHCSIVGNLLASVPWCISVTHKHLLELFFLRFLMYVCQWPQTIFNYLYHYFWLLGKFWCLQQLFAFPKESLKFIPQFQAVLPIHTHARNTGVYIHVHTSIPTSHTYTPCTQNPPRCLP